MKKLEAVIFDMDGVLFDTERMSCECCFEAAKQLGLTLAEEAVYGGCGRNEASLRRHIMETEEPGIRMEPFLMKNIGNGLWRCFRRVWNGSFQLKRV